MTNPESKPSTGPARAVQDGDWFDLYINNVRIISFVPFIRLCDVEKTTGKINYALAPLLQENEALKRKAEWSERAAEAIAELKDADSSERKTEAIQEIFDLFAEFDALPKEGKP